MNEHCKCEDCPEKIDLGGIHVSLIDDEGEFFLHIECFVNGDWMRDDDVAKQGFAQSCLNMN